MSKPAFLIFALTGLLWSLLIWISLRFAVDTGALEAPLEWRKCSALGYVALFITVWTKAAFNSSDV